jgi:FixJ family two-component response regulator
MSIDRISGKTLEVVMADGLVISIVDDDPSVCEGLIDLMNSMGFQAEAYRSADEFLGSDRVATTACLISDVQMPGMGGFELHDRLLKDGTPIPTILITAFPKDADRARARRSGVRCYLSKPFSENDLLACLRASIAAQGPGKIG